MVLLLLFSENIETFTEVWRMWQWDQIIDNSQNDTMLSILRGLITDVTLIILYNKLIVV